MPASRRRHRRASQLGPAKFGTRHRGAQDPDSPPDQAIPMLKDRFSPLVIWGNPSGTVSTR